MSSFSLPRCDCSEPFLACRVPNLKLDSFAIQFNGSNLEIDADGADVAFRIGIVGESQQKAGFANAGVTNQQKLEQIVAAMTKTSWVNAS